MDKLSPDMLIYILVIAGILIFNYLAQRAAAKQQQEEAAARRQQEEAAAGGEPPPAQDDPFGEIFGRGRRLPEPELPPETLPAPVRRVEVRPAAVAAEVPRRRRLAARALVQGKGNLQRAVVAMTILGPCRSMDPSGNGSAAPAPGQRAP